MDKIYNYKRLAKELKKNARGLIEESPTQSKQTQTIIKAKANELYELADKIVSEVGEIKQYEVDTYYFDLLDYIKYELQDVKLNGNLSGGYLEAQGKSGALVLLRSKLIDKKIKLTDRW